MQVARDRTIRIVRYADETPSIMSPAYKIFQVIDKNILNPEFLMLYFLRPEFDRLCWFYTDSSIRGSLDWAKFCNLKVPVPPIDIQEKIVNIYNFLNERIHLKNKINKNLEAIANNIFKRYFLSYEPFNYLSFNESILGSIPIEWQFTTISEVIEVKDGTHDSPSSVNVGFPLITSTHLNEYGVNKKEANEISFEDYKKINKRSLVEPFDILISMIGTVGNICYITYDEVDFAIKNVGLFKTSKTPLLREYLLLYLKSNAVNRYIDSHLAGSTQKYIRLSDLRNIPIIIPPDDVLKEFKNIVTPIFDNIKNNYKEIDNLITLRDILLPKLMSGEIDVSLINSYLE